jgi:hypothetical protein
MFDEPQSRLGHFSAFCATGMNSRKSLLYAGPRAAILPGLLSQLLPKFDHLDVARLLHRQLKRVGMFY